MARSTRASSSEIEDDFDALLGRAFLKAYQAQLQALEVDRKRGDAQGLTSAGRWSGGQASFVPGAVAARRPLGLAATRVSRKTT